MAEYIERGELEKVLINFYDRLAGCRPDFYAGFSAALKVIDEETTNADVAPVRHGRWEWFEEWSPSTPDHPAECEDFGWRCSECKASLEDIVGGYWDDIDVEPMLNFCPKCGTNMDGE